MNPSHILIARNSRGHNPSASLSSPTETHAAAAGIFRSSGSPPWYLEECETDDIVSELSFDGDDEGSIEIDETFTPHCKFPGTVKIVVESTTFWAHKEVLVFASPFFEAALSGNWAETGRPPSMSSVITISQPPSIPGDENLTREAPEVLFTSAEDEGDHDQHVPDIDITPATESDGNDLEIKVSQKAQARENALGKLQGNETPREYGASNEARRDKPSSSDQLSPGKPRKRHMSTGPDAVVILKEEKACVFHDFLKFVYPHLQCTVAWNNVEGLFNISHKLCVAPLQKECRNFLVTHAAGKPIKAMRIAELFEEEELYREASRFVLDNPGGWTDDEMGTLSRDTLLKLEKRRTWFLERVLKLGLTQIAKEYECCATCPDPPVCARLLEEKWRQAYHAVFRFGPCQPSMVYRYLRTFEGISPPLALTHLSCQNHAKAFVATLFDRMFSLGLRGSGTDTAPIPARNGVPAPTPGPRRHFLYCSLKPEGAPKKK
ncbi:hypothetical protein JAAARDRAFT_37287 [Jaapia argillacea MUCL 33604]|uniref:BTB domain-containing protein n=1 Tax=Jaapia argillacea MUCL 33604 TaxID=933084 RepID=A0A067PLZ7_9AGAM|nr:hypothetical protein JAAARDRAFT_37287 [Jaapia argillacea MUCL 33604]